MEPLDCTRVTAFVARDTVDDPSMVCDDVVATVMVPAPLFLTMYTRPVAPTAVGSVTVNVPVVQFTV